MNYIILKHRHCWKNEGIMLTISWSTFDIIHTNNSSFAVFLVTFHLETKKNQDEPTPFTRQFKNLRMNLTIQLVGEMIFRHFIKPYYPSIIPVLSQHHPYKKKKTAVFSPRFWPGARRWLLAMAVPSQSRRKGMESSSILVRM